MIDNFNIMLIITFFTNFSTKFQEQFLEFFAEFSHFEEIQNFMFSFSNLKILSEFKVYIINLKKQKALPSFKIILDLRKWLSINFILFGNCKSGHATFQIVFERRKKRKLSDLRNFRKFRYLNWKSILTRDSYIMISYAIEKIKK